MARKKRRRGQEAVELNLAAMLDMAFQLLTFFILTFKPAPVEGQITLRLPPPMPLTNTDPNAKDLGKTDSTDPVKGFNTLAIIVTATNDGAVAQIFVAQQEVPIDPKLNFFSTKLATLLNDPGSPFDQVVIQVGSKLRYDQLMRVVEVCTRQTIGGDPKTKLTKLSLVDENS